MNGFVQAGDLSSEALFEEAQKVIPGGVNSLFRRPLSPVAMVKAKGAHLWDAEGREYIDYACGYGSILLGHCDDRVTSRVHSVSGILDTAGVGNTIYELELAQKLHEHVPSCEMSLLVVTGSEATYHAARLSRAVTGRTDLIRMDGSYHGWHDYLIAPSPGWSEGFGGGVLYDARKHTWDVPMNDMGAVERAVKDSGDQVAAVFVEPLMHNAGFIPPEPGYFEALRDFCAEKGIVLIFDEIICGFRHCLGGYQALCGITPDLSLVGKAMANGYPISAVCGKSDLMMRFNSAPDGDVLIGGTYNGQSAACAAALATIDVLEKEDIYTPLYALGDRLRAGLRQIIRESGVDAFATGFGSVWVVYFMPERPIRNFADLSGPDYNEKLDQRFRQLMVEAGCWVIPVNRKRSYLCAAHTAEDIDRTLEKAETVFKRLGREQES